MDLRRRNMDLRRARILEAARRIIHDSGLEALSVRALATAAEVTVPTLYNLIGSRDDILSALCNDSLDELDRRLDALPAGADGLARAEAIVVLSAELFASDPETYRPVLMALEHQPPQDGPAPRQHRTLARCAALQAAACRAAAAEGALRGRLDADLLSHQILGLYRLAMRRWARGEVDDVGFIDNALYGLFVCLLADASETAAPAISQRLADIETRLATPARALTA